MKTGIILVNIEYPSYLIKVDDETEQVEQEVVQVETPRRKKKRNKDSP